MWTTEEGKPVLRDAVPDGNGGWRPGGRHSETCPYEVAKREKAACVTCKLIKGIDPLHLTEDQISDPKYCVEHSRMSRVYIKPLKRTVAKGRDALIELRKERKREVRRELKRAETAEGSTRLDAVLGTFGSDSP